MSECCCVRNELQFELQWQVNCGWRSWQWTWFHFPNSTSSWSASCFWLRGLYKLCDSISNSCSEDYSPLSIKHSQKKEERLLEAFNNTVNWLSLDWCSRCYLPKTQCALVIPGMGDTWRPPPTSKGKCQPKKCMNNCWTCRIRTDRFGRVDSQQHQILRLRRPSQKLEGDSDFRLKLSAI